MVLVSESLLNGRDRSKVGLHHLVGCSFRLIPIAPHLTLESLVK